ncbi:MAG: SWIM zinc finger family protein [Gammaproteobacteria bacterium]|nr:SWIM zinc finger family protein [Gammaproteobacteria bacterium]
MQKPPLARLITTRRLQNLAGERSYKRGCAYFEAGAVERLVVRKERITARVTGSELYTIKLWPEGRDLDWDCTCPMGEDGAFCKHAVATCLAWLAARKEGTAVDTDSDLEILRQHLEHRDKSDLVEIILARAEEDEPFATALLIDAQRQGVTNPIAVHKLIRDALSARGFIDYRHMRTFAARAAVIPELLRGLLRGKNAGTALELATDAAHRGLKTLLQADDSDGVLGGIVSDIAAIHLEAARKSRLAPEKLAEMLFSLQCADGFGFFTLESYLPLLDKPGLAAYHKLATQVWNKIPALVRGDDKLDEEDNHRFEISHIMQTLAKLDGNTDALIEVLRRDLTQPWHYLKIAELLAQVGRHDEALQWAEQGSAAFAGQLMHPLDDFLVAAYQRVKRHDDAIALRWSRFEAHPSLNAYQQLKAAADKIKDWPAWRGRALVALNKKRSAMGRRGKPGAWVGTDDGGTVLVQIHLWEGNPRAAEEMARKTSCHALLWLDIAKALETDSPEEAIAIYQAQIEPIVNRTSNDAYDEATRIASRVRELMVKAGRAGEFNPWLDRLRTLHKAKRNFMQRLQRFAGESLAIIPP